LLVLLQHEQQIQEEILVLGGQQLRMPFEGSFEENFSLGAHVILVEQARSFLSSLQQLTTCCKFAARKHGRKH
jgi:hypothetical protein